jgi:hypothetical protein
MTRLLLVGFIAAILAACAFTSGTESGHASTAEAQPSSRQASLRGVWKVTEFSSRKIGGEWQPFPIHASLYIFTEQHYSYMVAPGIGPRRLHSGDPNRPSDAEKVAAYDSFVAASGTYVLSGSDLALTALLHKNPNEMVGEQLRYTIEISGNTLQMTIVDPPFSPGNERRTTLTRIGN